MIGPYIYTSLRKVDGSPVFRPGSVEIRQVWEIGQARRVAAVGRGRLHQGQRQGVFERCLFGNTSPGPSAGPENVSAHPDRRIDGGVGGSGARQHRARFLFREIRKRPGSAGNRQI